MARTSPLIKQYLTHLKIERALSPNTIQSYALDLASLQRWTSTNNNSIRNLTERDIEHWLGTLSRANLKTTSIARALSAARSFFQFLLLDGHVERDPTEDLTGPKKTRPLPVTLTTNEVNQLLATPDTATKDGLRDRALLELLYATGLRISEAVSLRHRDLNIQQRLIRCTGKGNKEREVPISRDAIVWIERYRTTAHRRATPTAFVFTNQGNPLTRQFAWSLIDRYALQARLKNVGPHTLRHSFATHLLQNGAKTIHVQLLLGHAHISTTAIYTHITPRHKRRSYDLHHPRARARVPQ